MQESLRLYKLNPNGFSFFQIITVFIVGLLSIFILHISIVQTGSPLLLLVLSSSCLFLLWLLFNPKIWIYSIVLLTGIFTSTSGGGVSGIDVVFIIFFNAFLYLWIIWQIFVKKEKLIESKTDWLLISFYILTILTIITVFENSTLFFEWLREFALLTLILFYFPFKKYITSKKDIFTILILFTVTLLITDLLQFYIYKQILSNITYAYEAGSSVRNNLFIFVVGCTFSCIFIFYQKKTIPRIALTMIMILTLGALASTFARIFWVAIFVNFVAIFILINNKEKFRFLAYFIISVFAAYLIASIFFGDIFKFVIFALESRFESTSKGSTDISALARIEEWKIIFERIKESPFIGNGFGSTYTFRNPISGQNDYTSIIHNSFLHFFFRVGIPLTIMFFSIFIIIFIKSLFYSLKIKIDLFYKILMIAVFLSFVTLFITGMFTMTFILRDALILNAFFFFLVNYVEVKYKKKLIN